MFDRILIESVNGGSFKLGDVQYTPKKGDCFFIENYSKHRNTLLFLAKSGYVQIVVQQAGKTVIEVDSVIHKKSGGKNSVINTIKKNEELVETIKQNIKKIEEMIQIKNEYLANHIGAKPDVQIKQVQKSVVSLGLDKVVNLVLEDRQIKLEILGELK